MKILVKEFTDKALIRLNCLFGKTSAAYYLEHELEMMMVDYPAIFSIVCREVYGKPTDPGNVIRQLVAHDRGFGPGSRTDAMFHITKMIYDVVEPSAMEAIETVEDMEDYKVLNTYSYCCFLYDTVHLIKENPELLHYYDL